MNTNALPNIQPNARPNEIPPQDDIYSDSFGLDRFLQLRDVLHHVGIGKTTVYKLMKENNFPHGFNIQGTTTVVWSFFEIKEWMNKQRLKGVE